MSKVTSGSFQYSLNNEGLLTQSSPTPVVSVLLSSSATIFTYSKHRFYSEKIQSYIHLYSIVGVYHGSTLVTVPSGQFNCDPHNSPSYSFFFLLFLIINLQSFTTSKLHILLAVSWKRIHHMALL